MDFYGLDFKWAILLAHFLFLVLFCLFCCYRCCFVRIIYFVYYVKNMIKLPI